jgi:hypothetical protein
MIVRRLLTVAALAALVVPATASGAAAQAVRLTDPRGDSQMLDESYEWQRYDGRSPADLTRVNVAHRAKAVVVRARYVDLPRSGQAFQLVAEIRAEGRRSSAPALVVRQAKRWKGRSFISDGRGAPWRCGVGHRIDYGRDTVMLRVPRRCLDDPRWVRVRVTTAWSSRTATVQDNAHGTRVQSSGWTRRLRR